jgi:hypothetical protein
MEKKPLTIEQLRKSLREKEGGFSNTLYLCKDGPMSGQMAYDVLTEPAIDIDKMTVRVRISTDQLDRINDVVNQDGGLFDNYRENPVVLYGHGMEGIVFPVALSEDHDGNMTITREEDGLYAVAYHSPRLKFSSQLFDLVLEKFIRASSVGINPTQIGLGFNSYGDEIRFLDEWELNEWSYVSIGCNPGALVSKRLPKVQEFYDLQCEAANRILGRNRLDGAAIHPLIRKSLQSTLITRASTPGIAPEPEKEVKEMKKTTLDELKKSTPKQLAKMMGEIKEYDDESQCMIKTAVEMMPEAKAEPPSGDAPAAGDSADVSSTTEVPESDDTPLGAKVLKAMYEQLLSFIDVATKSLGPVEAAGVKDSAGEVLNSLRDLATSIEGVFASSYPDQEPLAPSGDEPTEDVVKGFLCHSVRGRDQLKGLAARLDMVAKAAKTGGKVSVQHLRMLTQTVSDLNRLNTQAKQYKPEVKDAGEIEKVTKAFDELKKQVKDISEAFASLPMPVAK